MDETTARAIRNQMLAQERETIADRLLDFMLRGEQLLLPYEPRTMSQRRLAARIRKFAHGR